MNRRFALLRTAAGLLGASVGLVLLAGCATVAKATSVEPEPTPQRKAPVTAAAATRTTTTATVTTTTLAPPPVTVRVSPPDGAQGVSPDIPVEVAVTDGRALAITVQSPTGPVEGRFEGTVFRPKGPWEFAQIYTIDLTVENVAGTTQNVNSTFVTLAPERRIVAEIYPGEGDVVGVGMPVIVWFSDSVPLQERAAVAARVAVTADPPADGAWRFIGGDTMHWRPRVPWPAGSKVSVTADLAGRGAAGMWFAESPSRRFSIGETNRIVVDSATHQMVAFRNGQPIRRMAISTGREEYPTASGIDLIMEKWDKFEMDSASVGIYGADAYRLIVDNALRITNSGTFIHAAPWNGQLGQANLSHGCINASNEDAAWMMGFVQIGDPVEVLNTPEKVNPDNGWGGWNMSYEEWVASALGS